MIYAQLTGCGTAALVAQVSDTRGEGESTPAFPVPRTSGTTKGARHAHGWVKVDASRHGDYRNDTVVS